MESQHQKLVISRDQASMRKQSISIPKIVAAALSGLAGGAYIATEIAGTTASASVFFFGSLVGAAITGTSEYLKERRC